jgi:DNA replication protein DnaC
MTEATGNQATADPESVGSVLAKSSTRTTKPPSEISHADKQHAWGELVRVIGDRYRACRLDNFEVTTDAQRDVVESLRRFCEELDENIKSGRGIVLFGPCGTGKDHLLVGMAHEVVSISRGVRWMNGMDLFAERRDYIRRDLPESELLREYERPDVLIISDPVPPWGELKEGQAEFLFRLIDWRYRRLKPIFVSANFSDGDDATSRIGSQVIDRLKHDAICLHCNWESYREKKK